MRKGIGVGPTHDLLLGFGVCAMPPATPATLRSEEWFEGNREVLGRIWLGYPEWGGLGKAKGEAAKFPLPVAEKFELAVTGGERRV